MTTTGIVEAARRAGRTLLSEVESKQLLEEAGIPVVPTRLATSRAEAVRIAQEIGLPAVLKVVSPDITHKSDVGGVKVGLETAGQVRSAYDSIMSSSRAAAPTASIEACPCRAWRSRASRSSWEPRVTRSSGTWSCSAWGRARRDAA